MNTKVYNISKTKNLRSVLRRSMTFTERLLWNKLRSRQLSNCKFRRQFAIGLYVVDFYCPDLKLAIEVDGDTHAGEKAMSHDCERQTFIEKYGVKFLRFTNFQIINELSGVLDQIDFTVHELRNLVLKS